MDIYYQSTKDGYIVPKYELWIDSTKVQKMDRIVPKYDNDVSAAHGCTEVGGWNQTVNSILYITLKTLRNHTVNSTLYSTL